MCTPHRILGIRMFKSSGMRWEEHVICMGGGEVRTGFWWRNLRALGKLEDLGVDISIILKRPLKTWDKGRDWINLAQDRNTWRALANALMDLQVPSVRGIP